MILTDSSEMPFGKHKGEKMMNVPASYLLWLYDQGVKGNVRDYIEDNIEVLIDEVDVADREAARHLNDMR